MWRILRFIKDKLVWILPVAMALGLFLGSALDLGFLKRAILPLTILMVLPMMVNLRWRTLVGKDGGTVFFLTAGLNFLLVPFLAYGIGRLVFPGDTAAITGMVLIGTLPTSGMTLSWTGFAKGNVRAALRNVLASLLLGAVLLPLYLRLFVDQGDAIPVQRLLSQMALVILIPMLIGGVIGGFLRRRMGQSDFDISIKPRMPWISSAAVVLMVFSAMALKARFIVANPSTILTSLGALVLFYGILFVIGHFAGRLLPEAMDAPALVFSMAVRNLSIALALSLFLLGDKGGPASLLTSLAFLVQVQAAVWYAKLAPGVSRPCTDCRETDTGKTPKRSPGARRRTSI